MKIGIVGNGYVGQATALLERKKLYEVDLGGVLEEEEVEVLIWDVDKTRRSIDRFEDLSGCDLVFICVPTPMREDGSCHTKIVENVVSDLLGLEIRMSDIIVRSTVPVGTCERLGVSFMPEFLTEANWKEDFKNNKDWIFGFDPIGMGPAPPVEVAHPTVYNFLKLSKLWNKNVKILTTKEAELSKYARNVFLATKVSFFNEIEELCNKTGVSYENVRKGVCLDNRIGCSHTQVPGPDGRRGYGGTCFPKDTESLYWQLCEAGVESYMVEATKARNKQVDRREQDWKEDKGRAVL